MNKRKKILIYLILIMILSGCKNQGEEFKKKDMAPGPLTNLNDDINEILGDLSKIEKIKVGLEVEKGIASQEEKAEEKPEQKESSNNGNENSQGGESEKKEEKPNEDSKGKEDKKQQDIESEEEIKKKIEIKGIWKDMNKKIEEAHSNWNSYSIEGVKKGVTKEKRDRFEKSLNKTTKAIEDESIMDVYDFGSQSLLNLKSFFDLYSDEISGDINELRYSIYQYYIRGVGGKKKEALQVLKDKEESINKIRLRLKDKEEKLKELDKLMFSLESMEKSLEENSQRLFAIKKDNGIKNLENLQ